MPLAAAPHSLYYLTEIRAEIFLDFKNPTPQNISPMVAENIFGEIGSKRFQHIPCKAQRCRGANKENVSLIHRNDLSGTAVEFQRAVEFNGQDGDVLVELLLWHIDIDDARHFAP